MPKDQVSSTIKALDILECFAGNQKEWSLKELVDALSMPQTTVFRQLTTLLEKKYLSKMTNKEIAYSKKLSEVWANKTHHKALELIEPILWEKKLI